ncbi:MAG: helix-turn-helix domain-containing protein [Ruminococcaceae bacterium]|nr:helix-turn-helix domain-containing protein [Oscillospiraceae bacterium]
MREDILSRLTLINEEERRILDGEHRVNKRLYSAFTKEFIVNSHRLMQEGEQIALRRHTRFADFPAHGHNYVEMTYVASGSVTHVIKHREITMRAGDVLLLNRHTQHSVRKTGENDLAVNVMLATECFHSLASALPPSSPLSSFMAENIRSNGEPEYMLFSVEGVPPLENLFENLTYALVGNDIASVDTLKATVALILRYFGELPECMISAARHRSDAELLQARIEHYLQTEFRTATLGELADKLGLSVPYLSKRVRELCGFTFSQLLQEERFNEAIRLLEETDLPVGDIIIAVGYENTSFFHNQFKERYHCSPFRWRRNRRMMQENEELGLEE